jgi:hypothetical protein
LACRNSLKNANGTRAVAAHGALLISFYAVLNLLDAYPKVDLGHFFMIMPPILILFGYLAQCAFDYWKEYLGNTCATAGSIVGGTVVGLIAAGIFLPSLFMMLMFHVLIVPTADSGFRLVEGDFSLVPRYVPGIERAEGIEIHTIEDSYWPPLAMPGTRDFFTTARRVSEITHKDDKLFSTMSSGLMLYFLADRDSIWDKANCYVFQTVTGVTTSDALKDFSDEELARLLDRERPGAIVVEREHAETKLFVANFPVTWSFIAGNYRVAESIGEFRIYVPR